ncbi:hypothetical protein T4E_11197 [Trichinella pseudospiralis]|uniref:Uncharacterized protein n=1 Tax=Trichinella pseudospiralis TaxID=6337 RepID=A0A0V0Y2Z3_TRIPS|nr:hypothetical protein T4E_11197 [Trichinella pseudospiralis]
MDAVEWLDKLEDFFCSTGRELYPVGQPQLSVEHSADIELLALNDIGCMVDAGPAVNAQQSLAINTLNHTPADQQFTTTNNINNVQRILFYRNPILTNKCKRASYGNIGATVVP